MSAGEQKHPYHLVDPSPWPALGSLGALVLFGGAVMTMHSDEVSGGPWVLAAGAVIVVATMFLWWRDVVREAEFQGHHTPVVQLGLRYGMALFIASEVMFFAAFFWAFFDASLFPADPPQAMRQQVTEGVWPPANMPVFDPWDLPFMNTLILLLSGTTVTWAHHALREGKRNEVIQGLALTVFLGVCFTGLQAYEYGHAPFSFSRAFDGDQLTGGGIYPSTFFMATGFHGFHVIVGTIFLAVCLFRAVKGHFSPDHHFGFEAAAWYWHVVDVVWLFLFFCIYIWGSGNAPYAGH
jgi:cytochrome c oxidase subunit 3